MESDPALAAAVRENVNVPLPLRLSTTLRTAPPTSRPE